MLVAVSAWVSRIIVALVQLASIRILIDGLGIEHYAIFVLLTGLVGWSLLADMGIGISVQNHISESRAARQSSEDLIYTSAILAVFLMFLTILILYFVSPYVATMLLSKFSSSSELEKTNLFFYTGALSIIASVSGISYKIWYAQQKGYLSNIVPALGSIIGFLCLLVVQESPVENRLFLSLVSFILPSACLPLIAMVMQLINCKLKYSEFAFIATVRKLMTRALRFWLFALLATAVLQIDYIVISQFLNASDIAAYYLATKIFGLAFFVYTAVLSAVWPIFAESLANGEWGSVKRYLKKYIVAGIIFMLFCTIVLIWSMPKAVQILAPKANIDIPISLIILLGLYQIIRVWTDTFTVVLQSMSYLRPFWVFVPFQVVVNIGLQWFLVPLYGLHGVVFGLIASFSLTVGWALPLSVYKNYKLHQKI